MTIQRDFKVKAADNYTGYKAFKAGSFDFARDEYFAHISWPRGKHVMPVDAFLRALMRDVAWGFFYGTVNFDGVFGTTNLYGEVDMFAGRYNDAYKKAGLTSIAIFKAPDKEVAKYAEAKKINMIYGVDAKGTSWDVFQTKTMPTNHRVVPEVTSSRAKAASFYAYLSRRPSES